MAWGAGRGFQAPEQPLVVLAAPACHCLSAVSGPLCHLSRLLSPSCHRLSSPR